MKHIVKYGDLYILNCLIAIIYFFVFVKFNIEVDKWYMFSTGDSHSYWGTANEFFVEGPTGESDLRPFLYPLLLLIVHGLSGIYGIWILQLFFFFISINLIFSSVKRITGHRILSLIGGILMAMNVSYIVLTFHALTEVTVIFLLSIFIYFIVHSTIKKNSMVFFHYCLLFLVLLALIKPLFFLPLLLMLFIVIPVFYIKKYRAAPINILIAILIISPIILQMTLVKIKFNSFTFSRVSVVTFDRYFFSRGMELNENITLDKARVLTQGMSQSYKLMYIFNNKLLYTQTYFNDLNENIQAVPCFNLPNFNLYTNSSVEDIVVKYMIFINKFYYFLHILFFIPVFIVAYLSYKNKKRETSFLVSLFVSAFLTYYILFTSPVSFSEGDRLVITSLPLWIFLYSIVFNDLLKCNFRSLIQAKA